MTHTIAITKLPYMGAPKDIAAKASTRPASKTINFSSLREHEKEQVAEWKASAELRDPYEVLVAKVEHLSQILGCTEAEAERLMFQRLASGI